MLNADRQKNCGGGDMVNIEKLKELRLKKDMTQIELGLAAGISQSSEFASKTSKTDVSSGFWPISGIPKGGSAKPWSPRRRPSSSVPAIPTFPSRRSTTPFFPSNSRSISRMRVIPAVFAER